jgi:predicted GNAT superfamily acetyltransferase
MKDVDVQIRRARGLEDYQAVVQLQKEVWRFTEVEDIAAIPILMIANRFGGAVLVAQDGSGRYIGFAMANLGRTKEKKLFWWSHMTAVVEEYRGRDVGLRLKMRQREEALASGIDEIHWTFDPMQALNAHFNIRKLGVTVREYEENVYGLSSSPLHQGLRTDRFIAEWDLKKTGNSDLILRDFDRMPRINEMSGKPDFTLDESPLLLEIPMDVAALKQSDPAKANAWQDSVRDASLHYFNTGYVITDFILVDRAFYVLEKKNAG